MKMNSFLVLWLYAIWTNPVATSCAVNTSSVFEQNTSSVFEQYGAIAWTDEKARLDNFATQLQSDKELVGYIVVFDAVGGCPGEAKARAIRAERYVVNHRGIARNRIIWRRDGYLDDISTVLQPVARNISLRSPFLSTVSGRSSVLSQRCKARLSQIKRSRW